MSFTLKSYVEKCLHQAQRYRKRAIIIAVGASLGSLLLALEEITTEGWLGIPTEVLFFSAVCLLLVALSLELERRLAEKEYKE